MVWALFYCLLFALSLLRIHSLIEYVVLFLQHFMKLTQFGPFIDNNYEFIYLKIDGCTWGDDFYEGLSDPDDPN